MSIKIGDNNRIKNSVINNSNSPTPSKANFAARHPIITGFVISLFTGFILLFSFWNDVVNWIERLFK